MKIRILLLTILLLSQTVSAQNNKILFVMSAADTLELNNGKKLRQTGVFLNEFYLAYKSVIQAGYTVDFATPNGITATIDNQSSNAKYWKNNLEMKDEALLFTQTDCLFNNPKTLEKAVETKADYIGLVIPGGQGLMVDLTNDANIPILLTHFAKTKKPTGLICHAPSLLLTIPMAENPYIGFEVNSVSPLEEFIIEHFIMKGKPKNRKIAQQLKKMGLKYKHKLPKSNFSIKDRNLVTSQNPFSGAAFNTLYLEALTEYLNENPVTKNTPE
ncbi:DJ-1/PfpI family protein [Flavobacterium crassostreae]|uniref:Uncharacterized protein n=1 Tax=Flavobacterium crassostreae TaxID=1763534 RepID=A0A1B9E0Q0_9FLAO|nr:DJ-1/PfpI family protein [Flavobacterium crassostreae]OCB75478.1 hypothetical protein LPBF_07685 [Flavobacterium crassostreae]